MNAFKTFLYMGIMHGFFTFYVPYRLSLLGARMIDLGPFRFMAVAFWLAGTFLILWPSADFVRKGRGTPAHADPPRELVISGPYRYVRNPIYLGALLVQMGTFAWFGSPILLIYLLMFLLAYQVLIVLIEEPTLRNSFGLDYEQYCQRVPRWIPKFRS
jgi:protein-S-isoprenylcysteine O-methyltransferase Ste14